MNRNLKFQVKQSRRARRVRLCVFRDGRVIVVTPWFLPVARAEEFVREKRDWILDTLKYFAKFPNRAVVSRRGGKREYLKHREAARELVVRRIVELNAVYNFSYKKIFIRNQKSRWGSCSAKGNLNFNYKIVHLPPELQDYLIVHELCHLKEFNHSPRFWALVGQTIPQYKTMRKKLKQTA